MRVRSSTSQPGHRRTFSGTVHPRLGAAGGLKQFGFRVLGLGLGFRVDLSGVWILVLRGL